MMKEAREGERGGESDKSQEERKGNRGERRE